MSTKIFRSEEGRARLEAWRRRFLERAGVAAEHREAPTSIGPSPALIVGDASRPALVVLHGALASAAHVISEMGPLLERYRIIAPDLPGQSSVGPRVRLPMRDDSLPRWLMETLDGLGVERFHLLGVSWGGYVARRTASYAPDRVKKLALMVPAGIVSGPIWRGTVKMMIPLAVYRMSPSPRSLRRFLTPLLSTWDEDWVNYLGDAFRDFVLDFTIPPLASDQELRDLTTPTLAIGAENDLSFPGRPLLDRLRALMPRVETECIAGAKHSPPTTDEFRRWMADRVTTFFESERFA